MENYNVSNRFHSTSPDPTTWWTALATRSADRPGSVCHLNHRDVPDWKSQSVPDRHSDWQLSGADRFRRVPVRPPAYKYIEPGYGGDQFHPRGHPGCAWRIGA